MTKKTLAIVGCGKLALIGSQALTTGILPDYQLIGTYSRTFEKAEHIAEGVNKSKPGYSCAPFRTIEELIALKPDYIIEAASPASLRELALPALKNGSSLVVLSMGAFADAYFFINILGIDLLKSIKLF